MPRKKQIKIEPQKIQMVPVAELIPYVRNPRSHPDEQIYKLARIIKDIGFKGAILVDKHNEIIAGHGRLLAAKKLGLDKVPVIIDTTITPAQAKALRIADNKIGEESAWITEYLNQEMIELEDINFDLELTGYGFDELQKIKIRDERESKDDEVPVVKKNKKLISKPGVLWGLGAHRLFCGDATKKKDIDRLMNGVRADMVFADPPYGINVVSKKETIGGGGPFGGIKNYKGTISGNNIVHANKYKPVHGDDKPFNPEFLLPLANNLIIFGGNYFANKLPVSRGWMVWDKLDGMEGTTKNFSDFEMAWTSFNKPARLFRHRWQGLMKGSERGEKRIHPTQSQKTE